MRLLAVVIVLLAAPDREYDVLRLKDGRELTGFVVSETDDAVKFRIVILGRKGETSGGMTARFEKSRIKSIERCSDKAREKAKRQSVAAASRPLDYEKALQKLRPVSAELMGRKARRVSGERFVVFSTCDDRFVREVTFYLEEVYKAYRRTFDVQRNPGRKIKVYVLKDFAEYTRFQMAKFGGAMRNPAFYNPKGNFIVAFSLYPEERAREIRAKVQKYEREAREHRKKVKRIESDVRRDAVKARGKIDAEAARTARLLRSGRYPDKNARLRKLEQWKNSERARVDDWEREAKKPIEAYRTEVAADIAKNRRALAHNYRLRLDSNKRMFECLFHEGFHAFSRNFLWSDGRQRVPRWIEEGLASYYERSVVEVGELTHGSPHPAFLELLRNRRGSLLPLEQILKGDPTQFLVAHRNEEDRSNLYYAQSWAIAHYMVGRVPQRRILAYVGAVVSGADRVKAFEALMGAPIRRVESDIRTHLATLPSARLR